MKRKALQMTEVWHRYGNTTAVENLSIVLHEGEVVCLLGPSGCGKSTALRIAAGLERLQKGVVELVMLLCLTERSICRPKIEM